VTLDIGNSRSEASILGAATYTWSQTTVAAPVRATTGSFGS
jgi:hypothetical protein